VGPFTVYVGSSHCLSESHIHCSLFFCSSFFNSSLSRRSVARPPGASKQQGRRCSRPVVALRHACAAERSCVRAPGSGSGMPETCLSSVRGWPSPELPVVAQVAAPWAGFGRARFRSPRVRSAVRASGCARNHPATPARRPGHPCAVGCASAVAPADPANPPWAGAADVVPPSTPAPAAGSARRRPRFGPPAASSRRERWRERERKGREGGNGAGAGHGDLRARRA
jgi:hypothetical protein